MPNISITNITYVTFESAKNYNRCKIVKVSENRPIIELFKFFGWVITPLCGNLDYLKPKTDTKLYKIP